MKSKPIHNIVTILGPTASGKTELACALAAQTQGEIISGDSRQVYRHMDIGTGKDLDEYSYEGEDIPYHLIDIKEPGYKYNIAEFQLDFITAFNKISERNKLPILCGGSGLYIETALKRQDYLGIPSDDALWEEMETKSDIEIDLLYEKLPIDLQNQLQSRTRRRKIRAMEIANFIAANPSWKPVEIPELSPLIIGVNIDRDLRREKITKRLTYRLENGMIEEVEKLLKHHLTHTDLEYYGLEYKWIGKYLKGDISKVELKEGLNIAIHQFAKRQMTWFRRMEKNGYQINWVDADLSMNQKLKVVTDLLVT